MIEIYNTHTITFVHQRHSFLTIYFQVTFNMKCLRLFAVSIRSNSDDGKHRNKKIAPVNIAFSSSRNAALIERKMLHYTTLSIKLHQCTLSEIKTEVFTLSDVLACVSKHCADKKQH